MISETQTLEKEVSILIYLYFSKADLGTLPHLRWSSLQQ